MEQINYDNHAPKRKRDPETTTNDNIDNSLLEALEKSQTTIEVLDLRTLRKLVLSFERRLRDNIEARLKYPDQPDKFADSEVELHDEIEKLKVLAGGPELYPELVSHNTIPSILGLLSHDNIDIAIDVVGLLQDLTDEDVLEDNDEPARVLVDSLVENNALELLVQNLGRLSESDPDEMTAVYNTLATIENMIEVKPAVADLVCERTKLLRWLLGKIKVREFDSNKQYASEILAILLQNSNGNQKRLGQMNGVDVVLQAVALYKSRDPRSTDEEEMVENLFNCLCCLLMPMENKERFMKAEGVELMIIIMKQKKLAYGSAIRALDFAMTKYPAACERFVDVLGLKTAFAAFMGATLDLLVKNTVFIKKCLHEQSLCSKEILCERMKLLRWLLGKIKIREFDCNKPYASEILAILLQNSSGNQKRLGQMNGVDVVLQEVALYKSGSTDEVEMVENLFDCFCCLLPMENKEMFMKAKGVELMIIIMKQKKLAYGYAIWAFGFAMTKYPVACERFVDVMGLKTAFVAFMVLSSHLSSLGANIGGQLDGNAVIQLIRAKVTSLQVAEIMFCFIVQDTKIPVSKKNKKESYQEELEERMISFIASLFDGILRGSRRDRLLSKFVESEYEKIDRLMELYTRYSDRVKAEIERMDRLEFDDLEMDEEERYNRKLESGLYSLQLIAVILGHLWSSEHPSIRARIELLLRQQKLSKRDVRDVLQEYHDNIGDLDGPEEKERARAKIQNFIAAF
ncbi:hypothetical protein GIB67_006305 [Kingdonia uniflora]|uniref:Beta-catenin-like protein 1 N-terminal domain-containing protein n=1 Tax=Kingdonia uniflora TaxID=39325 RepID=A0A7J7P5Q3_9MAGN|nr:hypothetical protein GIB67_006305 [Kingdonia uniflora]